MNLQWKELTYNPAPAGGNQEGKEEVLKSANGEKEGAEREKIDSAETTK